MFNQPLSFDISSVTNIGYMFSVRSARTLAPSLQSSPPALPVHAACAAVISRPPHLPGPHRMPLSTRQTPNSLSGANKRLIRCAWAGNLRFISWYGVGQGRTSWGSLGSCTSG